MKAGPARAWHGLLVFFVACGVTLLFAACERDRSSRPPEASSSANQQQASSGRNAGQQDGTVRMKVGAETFTLEVAATARARQIGLMHRRSMPQDRGMIFVFPEPEPLGFWMKNTHIPLDIVFLDENGKVVSVRQMKPLDETRVESGAPSKYAIELNRGAAQRAGVKVGDVLSVPAAARDATW